MSALKYMTFTKKFVPKTPVNTWRILKGDTVQIVTGKDKGKRGLVKEVRRADSTLIVEGMNLKKKRVKSTAEFKGGILSIEGPIHYSNVKLIDPQSDKPTSVRDKFLEDGTKVRTAASGAVIVKPPYTRKERPKDGPLDTPQSLVHERTYFPEFYTIKQ